MTAELALAMPAVVLVLAAVLTLAAAANAQLQAADAARAGARAVAIGEDDGAVRAVVGQVAGSDATMSVTRGDRWVEVRVAKPVVGGWLSRSPLQARGVAVAWAEP